MKTALEQPKLTSSDVLEALGLERRHARGRDVALAFGFAAAGALVGAGVVLLRAGLLSLSARPVETPVQHHAETE